MTRWIAVVAAAVAWGVAAGVGTPRGPLTNTHALWSVAISTGVGLLAGLSSRSRWAMVVAPAAFWFAVELSRTGIRGPSVDAPHASAFGFIVLLSGRGVHLLLSVAPMVLAAACGAGHQRWRHVRRRAPVRPPGVAVRIRQSVTAVLGLAMLALTVAVAIPAQTAAAEGGVGELVMVEASGHRLGVLIRGGSERLPVLLFVPGAPGGSEKGAMRRHLSALENHFVVATLDRRGGGASYPALDPASRVTVDTAVDDIGVVADYLRHRYDQDKIYLLGHSGGSMLSVLAVQRHPERYRAYIGTGQAVDLTESDRTAYADLLTWARAGGRDELVATLVEQGPPPYQDVYAYELIMLFQNEVYAQRGGEFVLDVPELTLLQKVHTLTALLDTWDALYPDMLRLDLRIDAPRLAVPVYFVQGSNEMRGLAAPFDAWYARLQAPSKHLDVFAGAGHRAMFEQPTQFVAAMTRVVGETASS